jgi:hypothetical protein
MEALLAIVVLVVIAYAGQRLFESDDARIERRRRDAEEKNIAEHAVTVTRELGDQDRDRGIVYKDSVLEIVVHDGSIAVKQLSDGVVTFEARYYDLPIHDDGDGVLQGGWSEDISGYIPGDWERHLRVLERKANDQCRARESEMERRRKEEERKHFGL